ncbi:MAG: HipA N-terminal domain-containing protein [Chlorobium sp.]|uniref:HipA N-terminal domain protein n=1 Tax=Chlorobium phaeobacteroides (strain BS1) TaxID=331678 RepID=B3ENI3_CHLPB|nr:HipA N-terminal domain-containing protein [Chlorobium phaeobacteroides]MCW8797312.1 HipA N-terminal domain-containing protein [Chlorobium sp.]MCW8819331.1 HipA N-terminal domain-containing protein [Ignavibacteriaceae bacterium]
MQKAEIQYLDRTAGWLIQDEEGYHFIYDQEYLNSRDPKPVSLTLPLRESEYTSTTMFPFFDGLIPEGWLLDVAERNWKLDPRDRMGLLMNCCKDCIGAVSVHPVIRE